MIAFFLFFDVPAEVWHQRMSPKEFRHMYVITFDGSDYIWHELDRRGIKFRRLKINKHDAITRGAWITSGLTRIVSVDVKEDKRKTRWLPAKFFWTCNELCRDISYVDIGWTFNPIHFYKKLLKHDKKRNYEIIFNKSR